MSAPAPAFGTFFLPGPTEVRPEVLAAMTRPMIAHRGQAFEALYSRIDAAMRPVFRTERPVFVSSSSATGFMEAAVRAAPAGRLLSIVNGAFAERFADVARACGRDVDTIDVEWGAIADLAEVDRRLAAGRYAAVTVVHSETSTGALTDVRAVRDLAHGHGALCLVDTVTGLAGAPFDFDAWELDFAFTGSQKALAMPPGLAFAVASERFMKTAAAQPGRGRYFDLVEFEAYARKHQTPNTPALSLFYAAAAQLERLGAEGMEARLARHRAMAERTYRWVEETAARLGAAMRVLAPAGSRSPTVTAVVLPAGLTGPDVARAVAERGYVIGAGYGRLRERTIRIGHMGEHTLEGLEGCLGVVAEVLADVRELQSP
ncbi:MAG TPA: alanine--glyoxylate aminotransferase family protein [Gemmatimonadaceae bacterium]